MNYVETMNMPIPASQGEQYGRGATPLEHNADIGLHLGSADMKTPEWLATTRLAMNQAAAAAKDVDTLAREEPDVFFEKKTDLPSERILKHGQRLTGWRGEKVAGYNVMTAPVDGPPAA